MQKQFKYIVVSVFMVLISNIITAQEDETIGTEVVVVKPYTPTISDAFKVKDNPSIDDDSTLVKQELEYQINSIPVASTFTPAKGKAAGVEKAEPVTLFDNYASFAAGNYTSILAELYTNLKINNTDTFNANITHHSSQGGIDTVLLDDKFYNTDLNLGFTRKDRDYSFGIDAGFTHQNYNWYGSTQALTDEERMNIDASHTFLTGRIGGSYTMEDSFFKGVNLNYIRFWDDYDSAENRVILSPTFEFPVNEQNIMLTGIVDYLGGSFERNYFTNDAINYGILKTGVQPSLQILKDDLTVSFGALFVYASNTEISDSEFYIYPKINASYRLVEEIMTVYGGVEGDLNQNSYHDLAQQNLFVSPTLGLIPTHNQYDVFLGLKGKFTNTISYNVKGSYRNDENRALFVLNPVNDVLTSEENYQKASSFGVVYDDVTTFGFSGELNVDVSSKARVGVRGNYFSYSTDTQDKAWHLPELRASVFGDFKFSDKWYGGVNIFFTGERDAFIDNALGRTEVTLDAFFDANIHVGYRITDRLSAFARLNNIASQDYQPWVSYPVQTFQFLGGLNYKFDFK
ncbi:MAG: TonB-dependent receptor [Flavobacteriaceae bacterium]|nr:TonB-dependent receptor [Flavobacteriaceae bacterium]